MEESCVIRVTFLITEWLYSSERIWYRLLIKLFSMPSLLKGTVWLCLVGDGLTELLNVESGNKFSEWELNQGYNVPSAVKRGVAAPSCRWSFIWRSGPAPPAIPGGLSGWQRGGVIAALPLLLPLRNYQTFILSPSDFGQKFFLFRMSTTAGIVAEHLARPHGPPGPCQERTYKILLLDCSRRHC